MTDAIDYAIDYDIDRRLDAIAHRVRSINELDDAAQEARVDRLMARAARIGQQLDFAAAAEKRRVPKVTKTMSTRSDSMKLLQGAVAAGKVGPTTLRRYCEEMRSQGRMEF